MEVVKIAEFLCALVCGTICGYCLRDWREVAKLILGSKEEQDVQEVEQPKEMQESEKGKRRLRQVARSMKQMLCRLRSWGRDFVIDIDAPSDAYAWIERRELPLRTEATGVRISAISGEAMRRWADLFWKESKDMQRLQKWSLPEILWCRTYPSDRQNDPKAPVHLLVSSFPL